MKTLILTDNPYSLALALELQNLHGEIDVFQSPQGPLPGVARLKINDRIEWVKSNYRLVLSIHCKQLFNRELLASIRCINVHPGYNPDNRGWYPQVFSIINGKKAGVTIHEIDDQLDHGPIILRRECRIEEWDTSGTAYKKLMSLEREMLLESFCSLRDHDYVTSRPESEGNVNFRADFEELCRLDLDEHGTFEIFLNRLRALTHDDFRNAYFVDRNGRKVFVQISLKPDEDDQLADRRDP